MGSSSFLKRGTLHNESPHSEIFSSAAHDTTAQHCDVTRRYLPSKEIQTIVPWIQHSMDYGTLEMKVTANLLLPADVLKRKIL